MTYKERWDQFNHKTEAVTTALATLISFLIFIPDGAVIEDLIYALIIGSCTLLMVFVLKYGAIWFVETIRALRNR